MSCPDFKYERLCTKLEERGFKPELVEGKFGLSLEVRHPDTGRVLAHSRFHPDKPNVAAVDVAEQLLCFDL